MAVMASKQGDGDGKQESGSDGEQESGSDDEQVSKVVVASK